MVNVIEGLKELIMTGQEQQGISRDGLAGKAINAVEEAGSRVEDVIGEDHIVVRKTKKIWQYFLLYPAVFAAILGSIPTGINIYKSLKYGVEVSQVAHAEKQKALWIKNLRCVQDLTYHSVKTDDGSMVQIGACSNGDVLIEVIPDGAETPVAEWVSINSVKAASTFGSLLVSKAFAANEGGAATIASGSEVQTMCSNLDQKTMTMTKVVKQGGTCTKQIILVLKSKMVKRETVPCNTKCK
jgi:hypothetical protein